MVKRLMSHDKDIVSVVYSYKLIGGKNAVAKRFIPNEVDAYEDIPLDEIEAAGTFDGITNISLSTPIGKIKVEQWSKSAMR